MASTRTGGAWRLTRQEHTHRFSGCHRVAVAFRAVLVLGLAACVCVASPGAALAAPSAPSQLIPSIEQIGVNTGVLFNSGRYTGAQIGSQLAALEQTGATVVRSDALWEVSEPKPPLLGLIHQYNWSFDDRIAGSLAAHNLRWLPIVDYTAPWDESFVGHDHSPPKSLSDYAAYAAALAARYGPGGSFWRNNPKLTPRPVETYEIWNEPDGPTFWYPTPDPSAYADMYASARNAIAAVQPGAQVIIGGLTRPAAFIPEMLDADPGITSQIDGVGIHPYAATPAGVLAQVRAARLAMITSGLGSVPLYVTRSAGDASGDRARLGFGADTAPVHREHARCARSLPTAASPRWSCMHGQRRRATSLMPRIGTGSRREAPTRPRTPMRSPPASARPSAPHRSAPSARAMWRPRSSIVSAPVALAALQAPCPATQAAPRNDSSASASRSTLIRRTNFNSPK